MSLNRTLCNQIMCPTQHDKEPALTRRALLTFVSQLLAQGAGFIAGFVFTPIIMKGLGAETYGVWGFIQKLTGFVGLSNLNSMGVVKLQLGVRQHSPDVEEKRRLLGANIMQWLYLLPLSLLAIAILVVSLPRLMALPPSLVSSGKIALLIVGCTMILNQLLSLPGGVLAGQNLNYKAMGLTAGMILLGGALNAWGVVSGFGLIVLAITSLLGVVLTNLVRYWVARRHVPWFGVSRPRKDEVIGCVHLSVWGSLNNLGGMLFSAADTVLVGTAFGARAVAVYLTTGALLRFAFGPFQQILMSGNSGIGYLVGSGDWARIERVRYELLSFAALGMAILGSVTILLNEAFVTLWVGREFYGTLALTAGLALVAFLRQLVSMESIPLDAMLRLERKTIAMLIWGAVGIALGYGFSRFMGLMGIPLGLAAASVGQLVTLQCLIQYYTPMPMIRYWQVAVRPVAALILLGGLTFVVAAHRPMGPLHWLSLALVGAGIVVATGGVFAIVGLNGGIRSTLYERVIGFVRSK